MYGKDKEYVEPEVKRGGKIIQLCRVSLQVQI